MKVRLTLDVSDDMRRAIRRRLNRHGLATRVEVTEYVNDVCFGTDVLEIFSTAIETPAVTPPPMRFANGSSLTFGAAPVEDEDLVENEPPLDDDLPRCIHKNRAGELCGAPEARHGKSGKSCPHGHHGTWTPPLDTRPAVVLQSHQADLRE